jgi:DNA-binding transcriptional ArsR family regulator
MIFLSKIYILNILLTLLMDPQHNKKVLHALTEKGLIGATITELVGITKLSRDNVRIALAALEGAEKVLSRDVGKAKLYRCR